MDDIPVWLPPEPMAHRWGKAKDLEHGHVKRYRERMRDVRVVFFDGTPPAIAAVKDLAAETPEITAVTAEGIVYHGVMHKAPVVVCMGQMGCITIWTETDFNAVFEPAP